MPLSKATIPSSGITARTSATIRCGVGGKRPSSAPAEIRAKIPARIGNNADAFGNRPSNRSANNDKLGPTSPTTAACGEVNLLHISRRITDMNHRRPTRTHDERRLLHRIMTDRNNQIRLINRRMHIIALRQRRRPHPQINRIRADSPDTSSFITCELNPLPICVVKKRNPQPSQEPPQIILQTRPTRRRPQHHQRPLRPPDHLRRPIQRRRMRNRQLHRQRRHHQLLRRLLTRHILRQLQMHRPRTLLRSHPKRLTHQRRNTRRRNNLPRKLRQRLHRRHHINNLKPEPADYS